MKMYLKNKKGFTLIELLVVVAIIGILASVVLASLKTARDKAKDASLKEETSQYVTLINLEYNDTGSYSNLQYYTGTDWLTPALCASSFSGTYITQARAICANMLSNAGVSASFPAGMNLAISNNVDRNKYYSIMVQLNNGKWFCSGSSGKSEVTLVTDPYSNVGCWANP